MIRCVRMWSGTDGAIAFEEGTIELAQTKGADRSTPELWATDVSFRETPPGGDRGWHQELVPRLILTLTGALEFTVRSGRSFTIRPGDVLLAEDYGGAGHKWRLLDDEPWRWAYVLVPNVSTFPFRAA